MKSKDLTPRVALCFVSQSGNDEFLLAGWNGQKNSRTEEQVDLIISARANQGVVTA